jgi:hypothetical protein
MFVLQLLFYLLFHVFVQRLIIVKKINSFSINHRFIWSSITIDNSNYIPIGLNTISHESLKFRLGTPLFAMILFKFYHITNWAFMFLNYISHIAIVIAL